MSYRRGVYSQQMELHTCIYTVHVHVCLEYYMRKAKMAHISDMKWLII